MQPYTPTSEWIQLHEFSYRKSDVFNMAWDVNLSSCVGVGARFGGPLAISRGTVPGATSVKPTYRIFSNSGRLMATIVWDSISRVIATGWSDSEKFVIVSDDYNVRTFNLQGEASGMFALAAEVKDQGILDAQVWGSGLVVLTKRFQFCLVSNIEEPRPVMMANSGLPSAPTSWTVIEPQFTSHGTAEVLAAHPNGTILIIDTERVTDTRITNGPFTRMTVSPTGKILATFNAQGILWVVSTDFAQNLCECSTRNKVPPTALVWCGMESVVCHWEGLLLMVGPYGHQLPLRYDEQPNLLLVSEIDGLRIISNSSCEYLQRVPPKTEAIFKIGSTHPAAMLYDACVAFSEKSPKADENIRYIRGQNALDDAVLACIESATGDFSVVGQRNLLSAAAFGKCFSSGHDPAPFVDACRNLRVVNAVRAPDIGMCMSYLQLLILTPAVLIDRLINRHHHFVAFKMCKHLKVRPNRVLIHWASCVVRRGRGDEKEVCDMITQKLQAVPGISYAEIASTAYKSGRPKLATRLLDYEPRAADQIPLLIAMKQDDVALLKAIDSGDTDLVYLVLLHSMRAARDNPSDFFAILQNKPVAIKLLIKYAWQKDPELLRQILQVTGEKEREGDLAVRRALMVADPEKKARMLGQAMDLYDKSKNGSFQKECCSDEVRLLRLQMDLEASSQEGERFVGLSVGETLKALIESGQEKKADNLVKNFKIPETRFYWTKVTALAAKGKWDQLRKFGDSKKPPIGFAPFADAAFDAGNVREAKEYVAKIGEAAIRAPMYVRYECYREAADCAHVLRDPNALADIRRRCKNKDDQAYIESLIRTYK